MGLMDDIVHDDVMMMIQNHDKVDDVMRFLMRKFIMIYDQDHDKVNETRLTMIMFIMMMTKSRLKLM